MPRTGQRGWHCCTGRAAHYGTRHHATVRAAACCRPTRNNAWVTQRFPSRCVGALLEAVHLHARVSPQAAVCVRCGPAYRTVRHAARTGVQRVLLPSAGVLGGGGTTHLWLGVPQPQYRAITDWASQRAFDAPNKRTLNTLCRLLF
mmetsp:Transcript_36266/g.91016  ORF Transcript_36266/g.91016 Transcript_36266/m.91016 type:complete len:146 (+) Transcript_36266:43-480(+)